MAATKTCPSCRGDIPADSRFCPQCGTPQALDCAACGHVNGAGSRFCTQCGAKLGAAAPAASPAASPSAAPIPPVYDAFTEGFDGADLQAAKMLLSAAS
jgi:RNA polymerase subunit RPABC4/transcription elongation factor Spt4